MNRNHRKHSLFAIIVILIVSALVVHQRERELSVGETQSRKSPPASPSAVPIEQPGPPTQEKYSEPSSIEERLGLANPSPLILETLNVLLSPPMESPAHAQAVETRILWETEGVNHIPELSALLKNDSAETRVLAASLLGSLRTPDVIPYLEEQLRVEKSDLVRCALLAGLADCGQTPGKHGETLLQIYRSVWNRTKPETDVDCWRLALMIGSVQGPETTETLDAVRATTDGGLGPLVQACIEIRALYQARQR